jgi:large subunit ribosomal protein L6
MGIGFKFRLFNNKLLLVLGYSHIIKLFIIPNVCLYLVNNRNLELFSINIFNLNIFIYTIKKLKVADPYKGKGIFVKGQQIFRKESKKLEF